MDPFFTQHPLGLGCGLGLSIGIVEAHGGRLYLAEGKVRTRFTFVLPQG